jgi:hypothetical protein
MVSWGKERREVSRKTRDCAHEYRYIYIYIYIGLSVPIIRVTVLDAVCSMSEKGAVAVQVLYLRSFPCPRH